MTITVMLKFFLIVLFNIHFHTNYDISYETSITSFLIIICNMVYYIIFSYSSTLSRLLKSTS